MSVKQIIWFEDDGERFLAYQDHYHPQGDDASDATLEDLADFCDLGAESANAHDFVGAHRLLAALLHKHVGRQKATEILREIAELGGLDEMNGVCEKPTGFAALSVPEPWKDWHLPE